MGPGREGGLRDPPRLCPGAAGDRAPRLDDWREDQWVGDGWLSAVMGAGNRDLGYGVRGPDGARPSPVEPLLGNLVEKDCVEACTPTHSLQGQVSSGAAATQCCQDDLCNRSLQSSAPAHILLPSTALGLALALSLLTHFVASSL